MTDNKLDELIVHYHALCYQLGHWAGKGMGNNKYGEYYSKKIKKAKQAILDYVEGKYGNNS